MNAHAHYAEAAYEKKLRQADELARRYFQLFTQYFPLPYCEDYVLDKLAEQYGEDTLYDLLAIFSSYYTEEEPPQEPPEEHDEGGAPWDSDEQPPQNEKLAKLEENFRNLSNIMCSLCASVSISLCNIIGTSLTGYRYPEALSMLTGAAIAQRESASAVLQIFPGMKFHPAIVHARRALRSLTVVQTQFNNFINTSSQLEKMLRPAQEIITQAVKAINDFITAAEQNADNPEFDQFL